MAAIAGGLASPRRGPAPSVSLTFTDFDDVDNLSLVGDAAQGPGGVLRLTPNDWGQARGVVLADGSVDGFETFFRFRLDGRPTGSPLSSTSTRAATGDRDSGAAWATAGTAAIVRSVAIEFDTFLPDEFPSDHVSVQTNAAGRTRPTGRASATPCCPSASPTARSTRSHRVPPGALYIYVDGAIFPRS